MKKTVIVLLALLVALPAVSYAGSATSRWDMTIGGYVKFDLGWGSQAQGQDAFLAQRSGNGPYDNLVDKYGNFYSYAGETRLNFLTRGPDAWGAKTSAFVEGHFRGSDSGTGAGTFVLRHAFMQFDWPESKLIIGQTWQKWGLLPTFANTLLEYNALGPFLKGSRQPLVRFEHGFAKNWNWALGIISPTNVMGSNPTPVDSFTQSQMPFWEGSFGWSSDRCGKIGPWKLLFSLEGFYGRQKRIDRFTPTNVGTSISYTDKDVDAYGVSFKGFIPIIPEKKGNKKGALSVSGVVYYTQNPGWFEGPVTANSYNYGTAAGVNQYANPEYHAPVTYGGWGQISYFITDKFFVNGWYGYLRNNLSNYAQSIGASAVQNTSQYILNAIYDVNAAVRFGLEGSYTNTRYASTGTIVGGIPTTQKDGSYYTIRFGAYYFF